MKYLYIFLHIPKTAGTTFKYHIDKTLKSDEHLLLAIDTLGLEGRKELKYEDYKKATEKILQKYDDKSKDRLRIIHGHRVIYGIHNYFNRPVRYFTFIRNPVLRTISIYNHRRENVSKARKKGKKLIDEEKALMIDGKILSFEKWLEEEYNPKEDSECMTMYEQLKTLGYVEKSGTKERSIKDTFSKFYFIGVTKNFSEESLYLYNLLGFNRHFTDQNISIKYFSLDKSNEIENKIKVKNKNDMKIYNEAVKLNTRFKKENEDYFEVVERVKKKRLLLLPFTQALFAPLDALRMLINYSKKLIRL